jgi:hypothetical protein
MRYRTASNGFARSEHHGSVVDLFVEALMQLSDYSGDLRLVGHSLGSQVCNPATRSPSARVEARRARP